MGWFSKGEDIVDWREPKIKRKSSESRSPQEVTSSSPTQSSSIESTPFGFFSNFSSNQSSNNSGSYEESDEEKKRKLANRLLDLTNKIEDISNQVYHIEQRLAVIEQKLNVGSF